jgi:quercetin dioxygenase-like cupin family protein
MKLGMNFCKSGHNLHKLSSPSTYQRPEVSCMLSFQLDSSSSKELYKDVLVRLIHGNELTLNYFELKNQAVKIPFHEHPVEHLVVVLEGEMEFIFENQKLIMKKKDSLFVPAKTRHKARVIEGPVKALEIYTITEDEYYKT